MTSMLWFMLGCWIGCGAGFLLCGLLQMQREPARGATAPMHSISGVKQKPRRLDARRQNQFGVRKISAHA